MNLINFYRYLKSFKRNISLSGIVSSFIHLTRMQNLETYEILFLCHDNSRPVKFQGKLFSPLIDTLNLELRNFKTLTSALPFSKLNGTKCFGNTININAYIIIALFKRVFFYKNFELSDYKSDPLIKFYERFLKKIDVKLIIGVQPSVELCIAASNCNISTYDVQHGIINPGSERSYYSHSKRKNIENIGWPDFILCRNEQSFNKVNDNLIFTSPIYIGNLNKYFFKNYFHTEYKDIKLKENPTVLFTFQPMYDEKFEKENNYNGIVFPKCLIPIIETKETNVLLKLHPSQIRNKDLYVRYMKSFKKKFSNYPNVDYVVCNNYPLDFSLSQTDLHITYNSASTYDAFDYNIKTILLDPNTTKMYNYFGEIMNTELIEQNSGQIDLKISKKGYSQEKDCIHSSPLKKFIYEINSKIYNEN